MRRLREWIIRVCGLFNKQRDDQELDAEIMSHLQSHIEDNLRLGMTPEEARRKAVIHLGGLESTKEAYRDQRGVPWLEAWLRDLKYGMRTLRNQPGFTLVATLTLALGIGANTAIFSVINAVLIRPLPYRDSERLVFVWSDMSTVGYPRAPLSGPELGDLRERGSLFDAFGAIWAVTAALTGDEEPEQLRVARVTSNFFDTLGASALIGRTFNDADSARGAAPSILLSWGLWQRRYGGDPTVVGRSIIVNNQPTIAIGIMPAGFRLLLPPDASVSEDLDAWLPFGDNLVAGKRGQQYLRVVGRMKPGASLPQAHAQVARIADQISREYTDYGSAGRVLNLVGLQREATQRIRPGLLALLGGVALVLLTACLNVAGLLLARASSRTKETAVRLAIGASRGQLIRQCFVEGLILAGLGGVVGVFFGEICLRGLVALHPAALTWVGSAAIDTRILCFTFGTALLCGLLCSFAPMTEVIRLDFLGNLWGNGRSLGTARIRTRSALVTLQIALCVVLLVGAGLMIRTFSFLQRLDPGYRPDRILSFRLNPSYARYPSEEAVNDFHRRLQTTLRALPGVTGVGAVSHLPFDNLPNWGGPYISQAGTDSSTAAFADYRAVSPGYLETIGAHLLKGRYFTEADDTTGQPVAIIDDLLAQRTWPGESALGKRIALDASSSGKADERAWLTVVGVVRHMRIRSLVEELSDQVYVPIRQVSRNTSYVVRTRENPIALAGLVREVVRGMDPQLPVYDLRPLEAYVIDAKSTQRFTTILAGAFAAVVLMLAFIGIYGLAAYSVNSRRYEFGIRLAVGAQAKHIIQLVMREGMPRMTVGLVVGLGGASLFACFLKSQLFGVNAIDMPTYVVVIAVVAAAGLLASWFPARRASKSNAMEIIRAN